VLILDLAFGDPSLDLLRARRMPDFPYVSVIAISSAHSRLGGLDRMDDPALLVEAVLPEPLDFDDLLHRIVAILRDVHHRDDLVLRVGLLVVDPPRRRVTIGDQEIHLTQKEFALLRVLASDPLRVFSKAELAEEVWGGDYPSERSRSVESHASRLRRKLDPVGGRFVRSYWGVGWRLVDSLDDAAAGVTDAGGDHK
jgi:DNA-binding response OmpR family regulator